MKFAVINLKSIIKNIFIFFIILLIFIILFCFCKLKKKQNNKNISFINLLKYELPIVENFNDTNNKSFEHNNNISTKILSMEIGLFNCVEKNNAIDNYNWTKEVEETKEEDNSNEKIIEEDIVEKNETDKKTKKTAEIHILEEHNINPAYTDEYNGIKINNQTSYEISETLKNAEYDFKSKKIIIYHTHTCESYTPTEKNNYNMTDSYRTTDMNFNVVKVGNQLADELKKYGFDVVHNNTYHDYPSYNGSYGRSLNTLQNIYENNKDAQIVIDLHRDAVGSDANYAPRVKINNEICAQVMFVIGTDGSGLSHPNWRENLESAIEIQKKANELYPGLFRPIILRNSRFNQQLTTASSIIEVGATGNTLEECLSSMKYVAEIFSKLDLRGET